MDSKEIALLNITQSGACACCLAGCCYIQLSRMMAEMHLVEVGQDKLEMQVRYTNQAIDTVRRCLGMDNSSL